MVVDSDTVVNPWAVMVESLDTLLANTAVARAIGSHYFAVGA